MILSQAIIFILGWPLEWTGIIVIFVPIFLPMLKHFNIDRLHDLHVHLAGHDAVAAELSVRRLSGHFPRPHIPEGGTAMRSPHRRPSPRAAFA